MKVFFSPQTITYLSELIEILYLNDYFGFKDDAKKYVEDLAHEINSSIDKKKRTKAPDHFSKYGDNLSYVVYRKNRQTQWYIFFKVIEDMYYIEYIGNNHTVAQYIRD